MVDRTKTKILREEWEAGPRLAELRLDRANLLRVRATAVGAAAEATPFHPANAAGTLSYQHGTFALRNEHVGKDGWLSDRPNGVEAVKNEEIRVRLVFANVDVACSNEHEQLPNGNFVPLYFGESGDLSQRMPGHEVWLKAVRTGATHAMAHATPAGYLARLVEERDLIAFWNPALNTQHRTTG